MTLSPLLPLYLTHLRVLGRSPYTITNAACAVRDLFAFLAQEQVDQLEDVSADLLRAYQQDLAFRLTADGTPLALSTQAQRLGIIKRFTRFLVEQNYLIRDPGKGLTPPKRAHRLPSVILTLDEIRRLFAVPDVRTLIGYRDRLLLELLYDTGIRRSEVSAIRLADLDLEAGCMLVHGKGRKDRIVPVSQRVCDLVRTYILHVRPALVHTSEAETGGALILTFTGHAMGPNSIGDIVTRCVAQAGLTRRVSTHTFRHTCATHMLRNGAPVRHLQELLGHASLESTQRYTQVSITDLKTIHTRCHPGRTLSSSP